MMPSHIPDTSPHPLKRLLHPLVFALIALVAIMAANAVPEPQDAAAQVQKL